MRRQLRQRAGRDNQRAVQGRADPPPCAVEGPRRRSNWPPGSGSSGSTITGCSSRSAMCRRRSSRMPTIVNSPLQPCRSDSHQRAPTNPGSLQGGSPASRKLRTWAVSDTYDGIRVDSLSWAVSDAKTLNVRRRDSSWFVRSVTKSLCSQQCSHLYGLSLPFRLPRQAIYYFHPTGLALVVLSRGTQRTTTVTIGVVFG